MNHLGVASESSQNPYDEPQATNMNNMLSSNDEAHDQNHLNEPRKGFKYKFAHSLDDLLTDINIGIRTHSLLKKVCAFFSFVFHKEPKHYHEALEDLN